MILNLYLQVILIIFTSDIMDSKHNGSSTKADPSIPSSV